MRLITKEIKKLQQGCGFAWCKGREYEGTCGSEYPKSWKKDKRLNLRFYPVQLCYTCKQSIHKEICKIKLNKWKEFYEKHNG